MNIKVIKTEEENEKALAKIEKLMLKDILTQEEQDILELLSLLVSNFEEKTYIIPKPTALEMIEYLMEEREYSRKDLAKQLGADSRVSEFLNGKRKLSLKMISNLHKNWNVPLECLIN